MFLRRQVRWSGIPTSWRFFQFVLIHIVQGFRVVNETEVDVFLEFLCIFYDQRMLAMWFLVPLPFLNPTCISGYTVTINVDVQSTYCWSLAWRILSFTLVHVKWGQLCGSLNILWHCPSLELEWKLTFSIKLSWRTINQSIYAKNIWNVVWYIVSYKP